MARSIATILAAMDAEQALQTDLSALNSPSNSAIYTLLKYIVAVQMYLQEVLWDLYKVDLETKIAKGIIGSDNWVQNRVLEFQYDVATPQVLQINADESVSYPVIDLTKRIITRASVKTTASRTVSVKVAKSNPPSALSVGELSSLQGYLNNTGNGTIVGKGVGIGFAGVRYVATSLSADKIYIKGTIYFNGQYANVINATVISAINVFLATLPFDGTVKLMSLVDAIQAVDGVTDVVLDDVAIRADATVFASKTYLIQNKTTIIPIYQLTAGYVIQETTSGETFTDKLTFTGQ